MFSWQRMDGGLTCGVCYIISPFRLLLSSSAQTRRWLDECSCGQLAIRQVGTSPHQQGSPHFKGVFVLSDMTHCDGMTLKENMLSADSLNYSEGVHRYPIEYPTQSDFALWRTAIFTIFTQTNTLPPPLGKYLRPPALPYEWMLSDTDLMTSSFVIQLTRPPEQMFMSLTALFPGDMPVTSVFPALSNTVPLGHTMPALHTHRRLLRSGTFDYSQLLSLDSIPRNNPTFGCTKQGIYKLFKVSCVSPPMSGCCGNLDKLLRWDQLSEEQKENCLMDIDIVAKTALLDAVIEDMYQRLFSSRECGRDCRRCKGLRVKYDCYRERMGIQSGS